MQPNPELLTITLIKPTHTNDEILQHVTLLPIVPPCTLFSKTTTDSSGKSKTTFKRMQNKFS